MTPNTTTHPAQIAAEDTGTRAADPPYHPRRSGPFRKYKEALSPAQPDPWLNRKFAIGILTALSIWSFYVVVGRICAPVFQRRSASSFSVANAGGILAGYIVLFLIYAWSYVKMLATGPGLAKERMPRVGPPTESYAPLPPGSSGYPASTEMYPTALENGNVAEQGRFDAPSPLEHGSFPNADSTQYHSSGSIDREAPDPSEFAPAIALLRTSIQEQPHTQPDQGSSSATLTSHPPPPIVGVGAKRETSDWRTVERPVPDVQYGPRWCRFCHINKPDRTHHCRHCGTCIMQFDHHCIWVGGCVGWANHKFFMTFVFWAMLYCFYILIVLIIYLTQADIDGQVIGLITVSALFGLFTGMMLIQHIYLILTGKSTVEAFSGRDQQDRESRHLNIIFGFWSHQKEKRLVRQKWKEEYGNTLVDERWRTGGAMGMWKREMGESWYEWIFPIGRPSGDGIHFPSNPRFGPNGEWLKKKDWPKGVDLL